jgi:hypothetical protein
MDTERQEAVALICICCWATLPLRVDFDTEMDLVVDDMFAEEAEEFARAVVTSELGAVEFKLALGDDAKAAGAGAAYPCGGMPKLPPPHFFGAGGSSFSHARLKT